MKEDNQIKNLLIQIIQYWLIEVINQKEEMKMKDKRMKMKMKTNLTIGMMMSSIIEMTMTNMAKIST